MSPKFFQKFSSNCLSPFILPVVEESTGASQSVMRVGGCAWCTCLLDRSFPDKTFRVRGVSPCFGFNFNDTQIVLNTQKGRNVLQRI